MYTVVRTIATALPKKILAETIIADLRPPVSVRPVRPLPVIKIEDE